MSTSWTAIENALRAWVVTGSGLANDHVIWLSQGGNKPTGLYVELELGNSVSISGSPIVETSVDLGQPAGQEVEVKTSEHVECVLRMQFYGGDATGDGSARACASRVRAALNRDSVNEALFAAGVSVFGTGTITNVPAIDGTLFEARSVFEVRFYAIEVDAERTGYIDTIEAEGEIDLSSMAPTFTLES